MTWENPDTSTSYLLSLQLRRIIFSNRRHYSHVAGYNALIALDRDLIGLDCDEVYPNLYIADKRTAQDIDYLLLLGVTHILNVAQQDIQTAIRYRSHNINYMGIPMQDDIGFQISLYFYITAGYIDRAIKDGGKVLVNCFRGVSRSGAIALSYLMIKHGIGASLALRIILQKRHISPNDGFLNQLSVLDNVLFPSTLLI
ncbi:Dual specificity protein phosphatase 3 [Frankliniella fusca]|uniref:Dual specificity protein phosphatase n=1 Tax=Frankliniella fusca TaxID=407009 RepID=A0AAE1HKA8_9NEOP|nr:Dual specificity protein phosphatase 3 [Frankliniella fusca]